MTGRARVLRKWWWGVRSAACSVLMLLLFAPHVRAEVAFPGVAERVLGFRADDVTVHARTGARWRVEVADQELFGIAGLRASGVRAESFGNTLGWLLETSRVSAGVGAHTRLVAGASATSSGWRGGLRAGVERVALDGARAEHAAVLGVTSRIDSGAASLMADLDVVSGYYVQSRVLTLAALGQVSSLLTITACARFDGARLVSLGCAASARVAGRVVLAAGYDDGTMTSRAGVGVAAGDLEVWAGAWQHAVLGVSQGVSVAWVH